MKHDRNLEIIPTTLNAVKLWKPSVIKVRQWFFCFAHAWLLTALAASFTFLPISSFGQSSTAGALNDWWVGQKPQTQNQNPNQAAINQFNQAQANLAAQQQAIQKIVNGVIVINQQNNQQNNPDPAQNPNQSQNVPTMAAKYQQAAQTYYNAAANETDPATASSDRAWGDYYTCVANSYAAGVSVTCTPPTSQSGSGQAATPTTYMVNGQSVNQSQFQQGIQQQANGTYNQNVQNTYSAAPSVMPAAPPPPEPAHPLMNLSSFFPDNAAPAQKPAASSDLSWITDDTKGTKKSDSNLSWITDDAKNKKKSDPGLLWLTDDPNKTTGTNSASSPDIMKQLNDVLH